MFSVQRLPPNQHLTESALLVMQVFLTGLTSFLVWLRRLPPHVPHNSLLTLHTMNRWTASATHVQDIHSLLWHQFALELARRFSSETDQGISTRLRRRNMSGLSVLSFYHLS